ncbi:uncharacterized protein LOC114947034 isoform X2 [Acropora millepora]|uniref:uncharacterized protein LOC114947034 isoform X2 n=1 Tax=Acropora millepora TaxID=45264 RepID=UPI001CF32C24|nr:uncharacterized protein LOC114947034 isoform X2 [Acropora millepora]
METSFTINQGCNLEEEHNVRCKENSCLDRFQKRHAFRLWHILLFLVVVVAMIVLLGLLSPGVLERKKTTVTNDASAQEQPTASPTEDKSSERVSEPTEPAATSQPQNTTARIPITEATTAQPQSTTAEIPSTEGPDLDCGVVIVGGGAGGLLLAYMLLVKKVEASVCIFEKETRLGGKIYDHFFPEAPDVSVGLGELLALGHNTDERRVWQGLLQFPGLNPWVRKLTRVEARGVFANDFDELKQEAFPTLNRSDTVEMMAEDVIKANSSLYSTAGDFLSDYLSPEGRELLEDTYGLKYRLYEVNPESYKKYLADKLLDEKSSLGDRRPAKGLSELIELLKTKVNRLSGSIYFPETVTSVMKEGNKFYLQTTNRTVRANKIVLTVGPAALKDMTGDVVQNITNHAILRSLVSVPAFFGAAVYQNAWWEDIITERKMFISSSNCLGVAMHYGTDNGKGVLQTIANTGSCSDEWGYKLKLSKDIVDREVKRALEYKFQRKIPNALSTVYKYWESGFWYLQKAGTNFSLKEIRDWAKRPLPGSDVFLVGKAFYNFGGWVEDTIKSTNETLVEGWKTELKK